MKNLTSENDLQHVKTFFDGYARDFDAIYGHYKNRSFFDVAIDKVFRKSMVRRFNETLKYTANPTIFSILDVGCGSGVYCDAFLKQGKIVVGLDIVSSMLELAKEKTKSYVNTGKIMYVLGDYMNFNPEKKFDAACLMGFFDYIKEPADFINKLKTDVTKEIYMSFPKKDHYLAWQRMIRYKRRRCPLYLYSHQEIKSVLSDCGLRDKYSIKDLVREYFVQVAL